MGGLGEVLRRGAGFALYLWGVFFETALFHRGFYFLLGNLAPKDDEKSVVPQNTMGLSD